MTNSKSDLEFLSYKKNVDQGNTVNPWHQYCFDLIKEKITNKKVLDIGCWTGDFEKLLSNHPCEVYAIDINPNTLAIAQQKYPNVKFKMGNAWAIPFDKKFFDFVTIIFVFEHIKNSKLIKTLQEINRVLQLNGELLICVPAGNFFSRILDPLYFVGRHRHFTKRRLNKLFSASGFSLISVTYRGGIYNTIKNFLFLFYKHILNKKMPEFIWLENKTRKDFTKNGYDGIYAIAKKNTVL